MYYKSLGKKQPSLSKGFSFLEITFLQKSLAHFGVKDHLHVYEVHKRESLHNLLHNCVLFFARRLLNKTVFVLLKKRERGRGLVRISRPPLFPFVLLLHSWLIK